MPFDFSKYQKKQESEELEEIEAPKPKVQRIVKEVLPIENIKKQKKEPTKAEKGMFLKDLESILETSGYKVIIELNEKTPTRLKSGILQANKIKGYCNMKDKELDNELSKLIANNILKTLKGASK